MAICCAYVDATNRKTSSRIEKYFFISVYFYLPVIRLLNPPGLIEYVSGFAAKASMIIDKA
jgi:hypothetical protein